MSIRPTISEKRHAQQLAALLLAKGIVDIVLSPGSRSGPLVHTLSGCGEFCCRTIVDERCAGYFALGLAQESGNPVVLLCSSGTAAVNFAPAAAEAYHAGVPLIIITADRPEYWIDQLENQCITQQGLYQNFIKKSISLPIEEGKEYLWFAEREVNEILNLAVAPPKGAVHINIPFTEPLHEIIPAELPAVRNITFAKTETFLAEKEAALFARRFAAAKKIVLLVGQNLPEQQSKEFSEELRLFAEQYGAVVLAEHLANCDGGGQSFYAVELLARTLLSLEECADFQPDMLLTCGGQCVSKAVKQFLRQNKPQYHFHIGEGERHFDTYQALTTVIPMSALHFFRQMNAEAQDSKRLSSSRCSSWCLLWQQKNDAILAKYREFLGTIPFCDMQVYDLISRNIPENSVVHLGNSSAVRYLLHNPPVTGTLYLSNRGTSGIDGCLSTAVGFASASRKINTVILGDLSFFYDSNGLWNRYIKENLRIIIVNNGGGNIFGLLEQLAEKPGFQEHFFTEHTLKAEQIVQGFGVEYLTAASAEEVEKGLLELYNPKRERAALLEIFTENERNSAVYREMMKGICEI